MKTHRNLLRLSLIAVLLFSFLTLNAQKAANFSGQWVMDKAATEKEGNSRDASLDGTLTKEIKQNPTMITIANIFSRPGMDDHVMKPDSFLIGKVKNEKYHSTPIKKTTSWSKDRKTLTTTSIMTDTVDGVAQDFITATAYSQSPDGKTLTVSETRKSKLNGEKTEKSIYRKK